MSSPGRSQTLGEEFANAASHAVGCVLALAALPVLAAQASAEQQPLRWTGVAVFALTMMLMYGVSSLYHTLPLGRAKAMLRRLDHATIFLFIAGSYTPFALGQVGQGGGEVLLAVWVVALVGIALKLGNRLRRQGLSTTLYLAFGWIVVVAARPMLASLPPDGLLLLVAGGLAYTAGCVFFLLGTRVRYSHLVWHLFVIAGSALHLGAVLQIAG